MTAGGVVIRNGDKLDSPAVVPLPANQWSCVLQTKKTALKSNACVSEVSLPPSHLPSPAPPLPVAVVGPGRAAQTPAPWRRCGPHPRPRARTSSQPRREGVGTGRASRLKGDLKTLDKYQGPRPHSMTCT
jgi:hypothetical protein